MKRIAIYNPYLETRGGGEKVCLALAETLSQKEAVEVTLVTHENINLGPLGDYFNLDLSKVKIHVVDNNGLFSKLVARLPIPGRIKSLFYDIKIFRKIKHGDYDTFINNCYQSNLPNPCKNGVYMCMFPQKIRSTDEKSHLKKIYICVSKLLYRLTLHPTKKHAVYTYDLITANSAFTQKYIKRYWKVDSTIVYPICDNMLDKSLNKKRKIILNVGRFFEKTKTSHHKRQDFLVDTFNKMPELQNSGWELHLAGSVAEDPGGLKYIVSLIKLAEGHPIYFHFNCSFSELKKLYNEASIYWHATGYGSSVAKFPEKQEHFGISTVEAMSAGAIPVVINTAGQMETLNKEGLRLAWDNQSKLIKNTLVAEQAGLELQEKMIEQAKRFNRLSFNKQVEEVFLRD